MDGRSVLTSLAEWAVDITSEDVEPVAKAAGRRSTLDLLGVSIAAVSEPVLAMLTDYLARRPSGPASVVGLSGRASTEDAAFANTMLGHTLDFDDMSPSLSGHPTVTVLPAALAVAEEVDATGADLLAAYCVGVEVSTAIAAMIGIADKPPRWHPTAVLGGFGAAAASARLLGCTPAEMANALGLAAATSAGLKSSFGSMAKPVQVAMAARNGVAWATLARAGVAANTHALEASAGFAAIFAANGRLAPGDAIERLGRPWDLADPGIVIKLYPCCGGTHSSVEAALELRGVLGSADRIADVEVRVPQHRLTYLDRPNPITDLDRKFSLQYTAAAALADGFVGVDHFRHGREHPRVDELVRRVRLAPLEHESLSDKYAAEVWVTLTDGTVRSTRVHAPRGRSGGASVRDDDVQRKFEACAQVALVPESIRELAHQVENLDDQADLGRLGTLLRAANSPDRVRVN